MIKHDGFEPMVQDEKLNYCWQMNMTLKFVKICIRTNKGKLKLVHEYV